MRREGERRSIVIFFWASGPHPTSPVSPIVLHHNGGRLIILKTADYQSGRFQGPTSKQSQQYRTEREFLQQFGPLQIKKDPKPTQPAISFYTNPRTHWKCHCCSGPAVMSGGGGGRGGSSRVGCIPGKFGFFLEREVEHMLGIFFFLD